MKDGALGLSTSLQYVPARFAKTEEIVELAKVAHQYGGIYATHQRSEANALDESLEEVFEIARRAQIPVEIWHLKTAYKKNWGHMPEVLTKIERARAAGLDITADIYPYIAGSTALSACLPPWALEGGTEKMLSRLHDVRIRQRLKEEITTDARDWENIYLGSGGASGVLIGSVVNRELESVQGKRLSQIAEEQGKDPLEALFDLIIADHGQTGAIYFMMSEDDMRAALRAPFVSFCTDSGARANDGPLAGAKSHPRGWGSYPRILGRYVREEHLLTLEQAIHKMTGMPAQRVGLRDRGVLLAGSYADVAIFDPKTVIDRATFEMPNQHPVGIKYVIVNGQLSVDNGKRTPALADVARTGLPSLVQSPKSSDRFRLFTMDADLLRISSGASRSLRHAGLWTLDFGPVLQRLRYLAKVRFIPGLHSLGLYIALRPKCQEAFRHRLIVRPFDYAEQIVAAHQ